MSDVNDKLLELQQSLDEINEWTDLVKTSQGSAAEAVQEAGKTIKDTSKLVTVFHDISNELAQKNQSFVENRETVFKEQYDRIDAVLLTIQKEYKGVLEQLNEQLKKVVGEIKLSNSDNYEQLSTTLKNDINNYDKQLKETLENFDKTSNEINNIFLTIQKEHEGLLEELNEQLKGVVSEIQLSNSDNYERLSTTLKNDINNYDKQLKETLEKFNQTSNQIKEDLTKSLLTYAELAKQTNKLVEYLRNVDFPSRLDKIDTAIAGTQQSLINLSDKTDRTKDNIITSSNTQFEKISVKANETAQNQSKQVDKLREKAEQDFKKLSSKVDNVKEEVINKTKSNHQYLEELINKKDENQKERVDNLSNNINSEIDNLKNQIAENQETQKMRYRLTFGGIVIIIILMIILFFR